MRPVAAIRSSPIYAVVAFVQERRADDALALLRKRLHVSARVVRDGKWRRIPDEELVPGDIVHVRAGDLIPADLLLFDGVLALDQAALTGESAPSSPTRVLAC